MVFGRCAPSGSGVVDQNINVAEPFQCLFGKARDFRIFGAIGGNPTRINPSVFEFAGGVF
jgi:hypothetical protein